MDVGQGRVAEADGPGTARRGRDRGRIRPGEHRGLGKPGGTADPGAHPQRLPGDRRRSHCDGPDRGNPCGHFWPSAQPLASISRQRAEGAPAGHTTHQAECSDHLGLGDARLVRVRSGAFFMVRGARNPRVLDRRDRHLDRQRDAVRPDPLARHMDRANRPDGAAGRRPRGPVHTTRAGRCLVDAGAVGDSADRNPVRRRFGGNRRRADGGARRRAWCRYRVRAPEYCQQLRVGVHPDIRAADQGG